jgi:beta-lactamase class A
MSRQSFALVCVVVIVLAAVVGSLAAKGGDASHHTLGAVPAAAADVRAFDQPEATPTRRPLVGPTSADANAGASDDHEPPAVEEPTPEPSFGDDALLAAIEDALGPSRDDYGVVVLRLDGQPGAALNPDSVYYAASLFKLAVLYEAEHRIATGQLTLDDRLVIDADAASQDLGTIGSLPLDANGELSIGDALWAMVTRSDNATAVALGHRFGFATIDETLAGLGLEHTSLNTEELPTTADDMARLMAAIVNGVGLSEETRDHALHLLFAQETRSGIPAGLPAVVPVGNKTGTWDGATHDVAFVDAPAGTYVLAVLSNHSWDWDPIARVSAAVFAVIGGGR